MGAPDPSTLTPQQQKWFASVREGLQRSTGKTVEEWAEIVAHPREHAEQMREMGLDPMSLLDDTSGVAAGKGLY